MGNTRFGSEFFAANRQKLRELFTGTAPVVLTANGLVQMAADQAYPFCQDASFWYLTGIDEPDVVLVVDKEKEYLILPVRSGTRQLPIDAIDQDELQRVSGIDTLFDNATGWKRLGARLEKAKHVATLPALPVYSERTGFYANPARRQVIKKVKQCNDQLELLDISEHLARLRAVKRPAEIEAIQAAIAATQAGLKSVPSGIAHARYTNEYEIEADISRGFRRAGASGHAFAPVVAAGQHALALRYGRNDGELAARELVLCNVGATVDHYNAAIARTFCLGTPTRRQQAIYDAVLEVQRFAIAQLKPGVVLSEFEQNIQIFMGEILRELGLIKSIDPDTVKEYYPHETSHFLGLTAHDVGSYESPLEPGMVLTVEPGIYIRSEGIGIRIEDDILITPDGNQVLSAAIAQRLI